MIRKPTHPGRAFLEDFMKPLNLTITKTANLLGVSRKTLSDFVNEKSALSPDLSIRIAKLTNTSAECWMNMQLKLSLYIARLNEPKDVKVYQWK